jgi:hypothetical protein
MIFCVFFAFSLRFLFSVHIILYRYVNVMRDVVQLGRNLVVACNFNNTYNVVEQLEPPYRHTHPPRTLDIFLPSHLATDTWEQFACGALGMLTIAWSLQRRRLSIRLYKFLDEHSSRSAEEISRARECLVDVVKRQGRFRIGKKGSAIHVAPNPHAAPIAGYPRVEYWQHVSGVVSEHIGPNTSLVLLPMVDLSQSTADVMASIEALSHSVGPSLLIRQSQGGDAMMSRLL